VEAGRACPGGAGGAGVPQSVGAVKGYRSPRLLQVEGPAREVDAPGLVWVFLRPGLPGKHWKMEDARVARSHVDVLCFGLAWSDAG